MTTKSSGHAEFVGTFGDFHFHLGPSIRNMVQSLTRRVRSGTCATPGCDFKGRLDAAHKIGRGRRVIIEEVLSRHLDPTSRLVRCKLNDVYAEIREAHRSFDEVFDFICRDCHLKQTRLEREGESLAPSVGAPGQVTPETREVRTTERGTTQVGGTIPIDYGGLSAAAFKSKLLATKRASVAQTFGDGRVVVKEWKADNFHPASSLSGNLRSGYADPQRWPGLVAVRLSFSSSDLQPEEPR